MLEATETNKIINVEGLSRFCDRAELKNQNTIHVILK